MTNRSLEGAGAYHCAKCGGKVEVIDSRPTTFCEERSIGLRRRCIACDDRFTTFEISEDTLAFRLLRDERTRARANELIASLHALAIELQEMMR